MQCLQSGLHIRTKMNAQSTAIPRAQHLEISPGLSRLYHTEGVLLTRNLEVLRIVAGNLQKHPRVWTPFISLAGGVQEAWTKPETRGRFLSVANKMPRFLQRPFIRIVHWNIGQEREIIARVKRAEMRAQITGQRLVASRSGGQLAGVFFIGI